MWSEKKTALVGPVLAAAVSLGQEILAVRIGVAGSNLFGVQPRVGAGVIHAYSSLVDRSLGFVIGHAYAAHLAGVGDVGAAVGLQVQTDDLNRAYFRNSLRQQVDFGADQVGNLKRLLRGRISTRTSRAMRDLGVALASISPTNSARNVANSKSMRPSSGSMLPPVTCAP